MLRHDEVEAKEAIDAICEHMRLRARGGIVALRHSTQDIANNHERRGIDPLRGFDPCRFAVHGERDQRACAHTDIGIVCAKIKQVARHRGGKRHRMQVSHSTEARERCPTHDAVLLQKFRRERAEFGERGGVVGIARETNIDRVKIRLLHAHAAEFALQREPFGTRLKQEIAAFRLFEEVEADA